MSTPVETLESPAEFDGIGHEKPHLRPNVRFECPKVVALRYATKNEHGEATETGPISFIELLDTSQSRA